MTKTYAIADLHGRFDLLEQAIIEIEKTFERGDTIITLGDYIDRGPESNRIIQFLRESQALGMSLICLQGNHEDMMLTVLAQPSQQHVNWWVGNGGGATLISYGHAREGAFDGSCVNQEDLDWLEKLPLVHRDAHRVYVHAGVQRMLPLEEQLTRTLQWRIYKETDHDYAGGLYPAGDTRMWHVVHGHHHHPAPQLLPGRTNLDVNAWFTGRLAIGIFDDATPGGPVEILWITRPSYEELRQNSKELATS